MTPSITKFNIINNHGNKTQNHVPYSQHIIFLVTYAWAQQVRALEYFRLDWFVSLKHSSLLGALVNYEENNVL